MEKTLPEDSVQLESLLLKTALQSTLLLYPMPCDAPLLNRRGLCVCVLVCVLVCACVCDRDVRLCLLCVGFGGKQSSVYNGKGTVVCRAGL